MKNLFFLLYLLLSMCISYGANLNEIVNTISDEMTYLECEIVPIWRASKQDHLDHHISHPLIPAARGSSTNWAGYVAATNLQQPAQNSVSAVSGSWVVPTISHSTQHTYCAIWVGIDGYSSPSVEQIGTEHDWDNGQQTNYAWFEMYPEASYQIVGFPVNPGDLIHASVTFKGNGVFLLTITNSTRKVYTNVPTSYTTSHTAQRSCAEWIVEAPYLNQILPLAHFNPITFSNCLTTIKGVHAAINSHSFAHDFLTMVTNTNQPKATTSALSANGQQFNVIWKHE